MLLKTLMKQRSSVAEVLSYDEPVERRNSARDRRKQDDRRSLTGANYSGQSRRVECVDRRETFRDRRD